MTKEHKRLYDIRYREINRGKIATAKRQWKIENPEKLAAARARYYLKHKGNTWANRNPEKMKEYWRHYYEKYRNAFIARARLSEKRNRGSAMAKCARRRARKFHATPSWANQFFISEAYKLAALRTKVTGFKWHVDHIVPLNSPIVCGLHVEHNLQVIPAVENSKKGNRFQTGGHCK